MTTSQQRADEMLAEHQEQSKQARHRLDKVTEAIVQADQEVRFYQQSIISLESAVLKIKTHFRDPQMIKVWHDEIEVCRDVLSKLLDTAEGKLK